MSLYKLHRPLISLNDVLLLVTKEEEQVAPVHHLAVQFVAPAVVVQGRVHQIGGAGVVEMVEQQMTLTKMSTATMKKIKVEVEHAIRLSKEVFKANTQEHHLALARNPCGTKHCECVLFRHTAAHNQDGPLPT